LWKALAASSMSGSPFESTAILYRVSRPTRQAHPEGFVPLDLRHQKESRPPVWNSARKRVGDGAVANLLYGVLFGAAHRS
jgi:hypothetical protein